MPPSSTTVDTIELASLEPNGDLEHHHQHDRSTRRHSRSASSSSFIHFRAPIPSNTTNTVTPSSDINSATRLAAEVTPVQKFTINEIVWQGNELGTSFITHVSHWSCRCRLDDGYISGRNCIVCCIHPCSSNGVHLALASLWASIGIIYPCSCVTQSQGQSGNESSCSCVNFSKSKVILYIIPNNIVYLGQYGWTGSTRNT